MCGIVGTIRSSGSVIEGLVRGLRLLEYRGYDSSGIAIVRDGVVRITKRAGRLDELEKALVGGDPDGAAAGIGHTRWATHGAPTDLNAHPHGATRPDMALVHNGIFDNYAELKTELEAEGAVFASETDTEVMAFLIERERGRGKSLEEALRASLALINGYYALAVVTVGPQGTELVCARQGPPLALALEPEAAHLASDPLGLLEFSNEVIFLEDGDIATLTPGHLRITNMLGREVERAPVHMEWEAAESGKGDYRHYMLKEIHEQPAAIARTVAEYIHDESGDVRFGSSSKGAPWFPDDFLAGVERVQVLACGTALHAGLVARYMIEGLAGLPVDVEYASEFRYRDLHVVPGTMVLAISQSGETADTLAATRRARELGCSIAAICNVDGSTQVREADHVILTKAGPEIGVASTKAFTAQVAAAFLLAIRIGRAKGNLSRERGFELLTELRRLRPLVEEMVSDELTRRLGEIAEVQQNAKGFLFLGRGINYPVALEGALKMKEISYMHAEGYPAGEMKHGPIALIEPRMTVLVVNSLGRLHEKVRSNLEQVKARGGVIISVGSDPLSHALADEAIPVPRTSEWLSPILNTIPLQLLSYHIADLRGCDIDKPRNLAKSVTVE